MQSAHRSTLAIPRLFQVKLSTFLYIGLALLVIGVVLFATLRPILVLPRIQLAPGFALLNPAGQLVTSEDLRGSLVLYSFSYSACAAEGCSQSLTNLTETQQLLSRFAPQDIPLEMVTITLDPERDTPEHLSSWQPAVEAHSAAAIPWRFLTGDALRVKTAVGGGFDLYYTEKEVAGGSQIAFEPRYVLVDGQGIMRAIYRTAVPDAEILARDLDLIATEARNSTGIARYGYEAAHLFVCYP